MDLVGGDEKVVLDDDPRDRVELASAERSPARVVRVAPEEQPRVSGRDREGVDVERAALLDGPKASFDDPPVVVGDRAEERRVDRRGDEHTVAGLGERDDRVDHAAHDVGELEPERGIGLPAEPPTEAASTEGLDRVGALVDRDSRSRPPLRPRRPPL